MKVTIDIDVPEWANWMAPDTDGKWYFYEYEPVVPGNRWHGWAALIGKVSYAYKSEKPKDFTKELYELY
jgi:hypothetical protein